MFTWDYVISARNPQAKTPSLSNDSYSSKEENHYSIVKEQEQRKSIPPNLLSALGRSFSDWPGIPWQARWPWNNRSCAPPFTSYFPWPFLPESVKGLLAWPRKEKTMVRDKLITNTAKEIIIAQIQEEETEIKNIGDEFKLLVSREKKLWIFLTQLLQGCIKRSRQIHLTP